MTSTDPPDLLYQGYVRVVIPKGILVLSPVEYARALGRGKAVKRAQQHARRRESHPDKSPALAGERRNPCPAHWHSRFAPTPGRTLCWFWHKDASTLVRRRWVRRDTQLLVKGIGEQVWQRQRGKTRA